MSSELSSKNQTFIDQVAVVTGSSSGIGRAVAVKLAKSGADVVVHAAKNRSGADETAREIADLGRASKVLLADLSSQPNQDMLVEEAWQWRGAVHIWVNNAGVDVLTGAAAKWTFETKLQRLWEVDVVAAMRMSRAVGARMKQSQEQGVIVNVGWDQAEHGMAGDSGEMFGPIKAAVMAFSKSLSKSLAPGVRVNCVAPGWIKTSWGEQASEDWQRRAVAESLRGRWGAPQDVAAAVAFLASPQADFITGHVLPVNGGFAGASEC